MSFSEIADCPLMWSHYGDQHKGVCIGYLVPNVRPVDLHPVEYGGSRLVGASDVSKMLNGEEEAKNRVDNAVLFRKATPWGFPPAASFSFPEERSYRHLIGDFESDLRVSAECLFVDSIADIAVLGHVNPINRRRQLSARWAVH